jgi:hypothetical protein
MRLMLSSVFGEFPAGMRIPAVPAWIGRTLLASRTLGHARLRSCAAASMRECGAVLEIGAAVTLRPSWARRVAVPIIAMPRTRSEGCRRVL